jgi:DNA polymerase-1
MRELYKRLLDEIEEPILHDRSQNGRVLLIDGLNTFIRSWTTSPNLNDNGEHVGGITGFLQSIGYAIRLTNPTKVIIIFDGKGGSDKRKKIYTGYKSERGKNRFRVNRVYKDQMDEEDERISMKRQFVWLVDILSYLPVQVMVYDGVEADDVIAYLSTHITDKGNESVIMSTDKDFLQLVSPKTVVYSPTKKKLYNTDTIKEEFGIDYRNFLLYKVLNGDSGDNIPGISGCGLKTIIKRFPEVVDEVVDVPRLIELCKSASGKQKIYATIIESEDQMKMNEDLMSLTEPKIGTDKKLKILNQYEEPISSLNKMEFIKSLSSYNMLDSMGKNLQSWLTETFRQIIISK